MSRHLAERDEYIPEAAVQLFDPDQEFSIVERRLPHWSQAGTIAFITFRTWDSLPADVVREWQAERDALLRKHGLDPKSDWEARLRTTNPKLLAECKNILADRWNDNLDACHGFCVLRRPELSKIVADSLDHFNGDRYELTDYVIMPNHVHVLAAFPEETAMLGSCDSWKHYTAVKLNRLLGRTGRFWQQDGFDHLVRTQRQYDYLRDYVAGNPRKANLKRGEARMYSSRSAR